MKSIAGVNLVYTHTSELENIICFKVRYLKHKLAFKMYNLLATYGLKDYYPIILSLNANMSEKIIHN